MCKCYVEKCSNCNINKTAAELLLAEWDGNGWKYGKAWHTVKRWVEYQGCTDDGVLLSVETFAK